MMVPADGKFFMNNVLRNMTVANSAGQTGQTEQADEQRQFQEVKIPALSQKDATRVGHPHGSLVVTAVSKQYREQRPSHAGHNL